jgi:hypothetical protein
VVVLDGEAPAELPCHAAVLVARSDYFRGLLVGGHWADSSVQDAQGRVVLRLDGSVVGAGPAAPEAARVVLTAMYTDDIGQCVRMCTSTGAVTRQRRQSRSRSCTHFHLTRCAVRLTDLCHCQTGAEALLPVVFSLAGFLGFPALQLRVLDHVIGLLTPETLLSVLDTWDGGEDEVGIKARGYTFRDRVVRYIRYNTGAVMASPAWLALPKEVRTVCRVGGQRIPGVSSLYG